MRNIAVTGSFASGKSYVINCLDELGYKVFSCDDYVRELYQRSDIQQLVVQELKDLNNFDKAKLAEIVYSNESERKKLEKIIHPLVREGIKNFEQQHENESLLFTEVPLLFETNFNRFFAKVICVFCSEETRLARANSRRNGSLNVFEKIKKIQFSQEVKKAKADYTIDSEKEVRQQLLVIIDKLKV
ncbi:MAG: dephospho-CoA kinase [Rickettsiaceae bacterium]